MGEEVREKGTLRSDDLNPDPPPTEVRDPGDVEDELSGDPADEAFESTGPGEEVEVPESEGDLTNPSRTTGIEHEVRWFNVAVNHENG